MKLDIFDKRLLEQLQRDANLTVAKLAEIAGLSDTACWRRIKKLEEAGILGPRVAILAPEKIGLKLTGYVMIRTTSHQEAWIDSFTATITAIPWVVECHRMTGDIDYLLKIVAPDLAAYNELYRAIARIPGITDVNASFSMERIKSVTELPVVAS
ncbi:transcriptional regulator, AsnC family [Sphingopyxis sp. YR583]|uniref:Lrp/AsnC family transcriptional regulator n=1 Tax=Sphingopyxis sp. YR583 TaxID=1881047 RepID=UPI0008A787AF|nr:Lrp/AsnC family transcriptional regulator [Sphingopyxis sp. YR583]SEH12755.1 transcriptional regulator, AsnC family [Sphingopyxis sp. YR583]